MVLGHLIRPWIHGGLQSGNCGPHFEQLAALIDISASYMSGAIDPRKGMFGVVSLMSVPHSQILHLTFNFLFLSKVFFFW